MDKEVDKIKLLTNEVSELKRQLADAKESIAHLQRSEASKEILPVVFHKLKNKLTPILGYAQIIASRVEENSIKEKLGKIERNAGALTDLLNMLRDYFSGNQIVKRRENLNRILENLKSYFGQIAEKGNLKVDLDLDPSVPDDLLIPGQLERLVFGLAENAVLAIKKKGIPDGAITVKTAADTEYYKLVVRDNGVGIKRKDLPKIWDPFYSGFPQRLGLGLAICQQIVLNHDALYHVDSREGEFAQFEISFKKPSMESESEAAGNTAVKKPKTKGSNSNTNSN